MSADGGGVAGSDWFEAQQILRADVTSPPSAGSCCGTPTRGWWTSPATWRAVRVFLCWQLGEDDVGWFHEADSGFHGRQPL